LSAAAAVAVMAAAAEIALAVTILVSRSLLSGSGVCVAFKLMVSASAM
jgi:hypothetical protein